MKPLIYLEIRQLINSVKNTTRSPKRLIPALLMGAWVLHWFLRGIVQFAVGGSSMPEIGILRQLPIEQIEIGVFLFFSVGSVMVMYGAFNAGMMVFSIAHIDFLFPTPVSRQTVLLVKLFKDYLKYGFYVAFFFMFMGFPAFGSMGVSVLPWGIVSVIAVTALLILVVNLSHTINIIFTFGFERLRQTGLLIKAVLIAVPISALAFGIYQYALTGDSYASLLLAANSPVIKYIFAPARWCARLFLAPLWGVRADEWLRLIVLAGMAVGSFFLLISRKENIYEPALGVSAKHAARRQAMRSGDFSTARLDALREKGTTRLTGLPIPPFGQGAVALLWKSLVLRYRLSRGQLLMMLILPVVIVYIIKYAVPMDEVLKFMPAVLLYVVWILSLMTPSEMRAELKQANILKSMPVGAWKVMVVQAINSTAYLSLGVLVFAAAMGVILPQTRGPLLIACAVGAPFLGFVNVSATLISTLLYPDIRDPAQSFFGGLTAFALISLALIPSVAIAAGMLVAFRSSYIAAALAVSVANVIVGAAGIAIAGMLFRKFDPTSE